MLAQYNSKMTNLRKIVGQLCQIINGVHPEHGNVTQADVDKLTARLKAANAALAAKLPPKKKRSPHD